MKIIFANIRGIKSKMESLLSILNDLKPEIIIFVESHQRGNNSIKIPGYHQTIVRNSKKKMGGGLLISIKDNLNANLILLNSNEKHEQMWVKITTDKIDYIFGIMYGIASEGRADKGEIEEWYNDLEIEYIRNMENPVVIIGDMNAHIGNDSEGFQGEPSHINKNGHQLRELVKRRNLTIMNKEEICKGKYTREDPNGTKSIIDYVICNQEATGNIKKMIIDEDHLYKFTRYKKRRGECIEVPSDHNTILLEMEKSIEGKSVKQVRWSYNNPEIIKNYNKITNEINMKENWEEKSEINLKYKRWMKQIKSTMYKTIPRITIKPVKKSSNTRILISKRRKINKEISKIRKKGLNKGIVLDYLKDQIKNIIIQITNEQEKEKIARIKKRLDKLISKNAISNEIWKVRKSAVKKVEPKMAVKDEEGKIITTKQGIHERYEHYFKDLLKSRNIHNEFREQAKLIEETFQINMQISKYDSEAVNQPFTMQEFINMSKQLKNNKSPGQDEIPNELIKNAGINLKENLLNMINYFYMNEEIPTDLMKINIKTLFKGKGDISDLQNQRGLFLSSNILKSYEKMILNRADDKIEKSFSEYQAGGRSSRSIQEQLFILRSIMEYENYKNQNIYVQFMDLRKAFDKMVLKNIMNNLWEIGIRGRIWRNIYNINKSAILTINTPFGSTNAIEVEEIVKQGSVLASKLAALHTDSVNNMFKTTKIGYYYGEKHIPQLLFQDDIVRIEKNPDHLNKANIVHRIFEKYNRMEFHPGKTVVLKTGDEETINLNGKPLKYETEVKYLGDIITADYKYDKMIETRRSKIRGVTAELQVIISELGTNNEIKMIMQYINGIIIPRLLLNAETWNNLTIENINELEAIYQQTIKKLLRIPITTPTRGLYRELGIMTIKNQINIKRINFLHRIITGKNQLVKDVLKEQERLPGRTWLNNTVHILNKFQLPTDLNEIALYKKEEWKRTVKKIITENENKETENILLRSKKCKLIQGQENKTKNYIKKMNIEEARTILMAKLDMIELKTNYKGTNKDLKCSFCNQENETLEHVVLCKKVELKNEDQQTAITITEILKSEDPDTLRPAARLINHIISLLPSSADAQERSNGRHDSGSTIK